MHSKVTRHHSRSLLKLLESSTVDRCTTVVTTPALMITKVEGGSFGHYYEVVYTNQLDQEDCEELRSLEEDLGAPVTECIVVSERFDRPHPFFPGSSSFVSQTIYPARLL